jgi:hypothetical protein
MGDVRLLRTPSIFGVSALPLPGHHAKAFLGALSKKLG